MMHSQSFCLFALSVLSVSAIPVDQYPTSSYNTTRTLTHGTSSHDEIAGCTMPTVTIYASSTDADVSGMLSNHGQYDSAMATSLASSTGPSASEMPSNHGHNASAVITRSQFSSSLHSHSTGLDDSSLSTLHTASHQKSSTIHHISYTNSAASTASINHTTTSTSGGINLTHSEVHSTGISIPKSKSHNSIETSATSISSSSRPSSADSTFISSSERSKTSAEDTSTTFAKSSRSSETSHAESTSTSSSTSSESSSTESTSTSFSTNSEPSSTTSTSTSTAPTPTGPWDVRAHADGQCQNGLKDGAPNKFDASFDPTKVHWYESPTFPGAEAPSGVGYQVYWSVPDPSPGCRTIMMLPYNQNRGTPGQTSGNQVINTSKGGCFFGFVGANSNVGWGKCCGRDCDPLSLGSDELLANPVSKAKARRRIVVDDVQSYLEKNAPTPVNKSPTNVLKRWFYPPAPTGSCAFTSPGQPYSQAGNQTIVSSTQQCFVTPCTISVSNQASYSTTMTSSESTTFSDTIGSSVSVEGGVDFIDDLKVTASFSAEWGTATEQMTGMEIQTGNSTSVENSISLQLGSSGVVTFTPTYKCWTSPMDCGKGQSRPVEVCQPSLKSDGTQLGDYMPLTIG